MFNGSKTIPAHPFSISLVPHHTYWLNGETPTTFVGVMDYTGKYLFHVHGYHKKNDLYDAQDLSPDQVRDYISTQKEV